jgi:hypothetical protein
MMVRVHVPEQHRRPVNGIDDYVDPAVVEQIAKGRSTRRNDLCQPGPFTGGTASKRRPLLSGTLWNNSGRSAKVVPQSCWSTWG